MVRMEVHEEKPQLPLAAPPFHQWNFPDGQVWTQFHRLQDGFLLRFPDYADYEIGGEAQVVHCFPAPGVASDTIWHLYHNQVLPLVLSRQGKLVFHASAVEIGGVAVAFMGASGRGKSTLAASLAANGFAFLTDDGLLLERSGAQWLAMPSQPSIRLWRDSELAIVGEGADAAPALEFTSKGRFLATPALSHCREPRPLAIIYFLGEGDATVPTLQGLTPSQALIELVKHSFLLDIEERRLLATHFDELSALVTGVASKRFDYPRSFESLDLVRSALLEDVNKRTIE